MRRVHEDLHVPESAARPHAQARRQADTHVYRVRHGFHEGTNVVSKLEFVGTDLVIFFASQYFLAKCSRIKYYLVVYKLYLDDVVLLPK